jgi:hypothetical protein
MGKPLTVGLQLRSKVLKVLFELIHAHGCLDELVNGVVAGLDQDHPGEVEDTA